MAEPGPDLHMLNVIVADMAASLKFYRRLGVAIPDDVNAAGAHLQLRMPGGFSLELDGPESVRLWHAGWRADPASVGMVIGFALPSREAVDERYGELTAAGYTGRQRPFDAFWGARYAVVADPDGHDVGLMSPIDQSRQTWPPEESPQLIIAYALGRAGGALSRSSASARPGPRRSSGLRRGRCRMANRCCRSRPGLGAG